MFLCCRVALLFCDQGTIDEKILCRHISLYVHAVVYPSAHARDEQRFTCSCHLQWNVVCLHTGKEVLYRLLRRISQACWERMSSPAGKGRAKPCLLHWSAVSLVGRHM